MVHVRDIRDISAYGTELTTPSESISSTARINGPLNAFDGARWSSYILHVPL